MRRLFVLVAVLILAALPAAALQAPATHAAPALAHQVTVSGRLVAAPQNTNLPASLLLQSSRRTYLVSVTGQTQILDRNRNLITLADLHDHDWLRVSGSWDGVQLTASQIVDYALSTTINLTFTGSLAAVPNSGLLCLANFTITGTSTPHAQAQIASPCGTNAPLYLSNKTKIQDVNGAHASVSDLKVNDSLQGSASLVNGQVIASLVKDTTLTMPSVIHVTGTLAALPSGGVLCLSGVTFGVTNTPRAQAQIASPCADSSAFPVYVTATTRFLDSYGGTASLADFKVGDKLVATGPLLNGQFTPPSIKDTSLQTGLATLTGTLVGTPSGDALPTNLLLQVGGRTILVAVNSQTVIINRDSATLTLDALHDTNTLRVYGTYNGSQITALRIRDLSLPAETSVDVKGQLASAPNLAASPNFFCLANAMVTGVSAPRAQAQVASVCPAGQLPVYLSSSTEIQNQLDKPLTLGQLNLNDTLHVNGSLVNGQLIAEVITDTSL